MRYYHYLSANKVEMLFGQLPAYKTSGSTEVGVDLKLFKAGRTWERSADMSIYDKLAAVEEHIYLNEQVGTIDDPGPWIYGRCELGVDVRTRIDEDLAPERTGGAVLFAGWGNEGNIVLGGSSANMMPAPAEDRRDGFMSRFSLASELLRYLHEADRYGELSPNFNARLQGFSFSWLVERVAGEAQYWSIGPCEFLAKRIKSESDADKKLHATLATPLFVSAMDD